MISIITGGIGCGKSVVSRLLRIMGYHVYDCDLRARDLMLTDQILINQLRDAFGNETYLPDGSLNKPYLAKAIFGNHERLELMNSLVHPAVARDIIAESYRFPDLFVETAIYFESHFDNLIKADRVWCVAAPLETRIRRTIIRDGSSRQQVLARINSQLSQEEKMAKSDATILNDNTHSIIEQVYALLKYI